MGWDEVGWDGVGWDGMGWDGMGWDEVGWEGQDQKMTKVEWSESARPWLAHSTWISETATLRSTRNASRYDWPHRTITAECALAGINIVQRQRTVRNRKHRKGTERFRHEAEKGDKP